MNEGEAYIPSEAEVAQTEDALLAQERLMSAMHNESMEAVLAAGNTMEELEKLGFSPDTNELLVDGRVISISSPTEVLVDGQPLDKEEAQAMHAKYFPVVQLLAGQQGYYEAAAQVDIENGQE